MGFSNGGNRVSTWQFVMLYKIDGPANTIAIIKRVVSRGGVMHFGGFSKGPDEIYWDFFAIWVIINRAVLIICCEDVLRGCDILLGNFGNSESRLNDDTAVVYITVKDFHISLREDLQWRWLRLSGTEDAMHSIIDMFSCVSQCGPIAVSAQAFVVGLFLISFTVSKLLAYFLNYIIDFFLFFPSGLKMIFFEEERIPVSFYFHPQRLLRNPDD